MLLDTYAWIEFFQGTEKGRKVKAVIAKQSCYTSIISLAEIAEWCLKNKLDVKYFIKVVERLSTILSLDEEMTIAAGKINFYHKKCKKIKGWGMIDSLIYATARFYNLAVLTGDKHFRSLPNVEIL